MRRFALLLSLLSYHSSFSQINVQDFPVSGDTIVFSVHQPQTSTTLLSTIDHTGLNHTWDFSNWSINNYDTLVIDQVQGNLFYDAFPTADLAVLSSSPFHSEFFPAVKYLKLSGNEVQTVGNVINVNNNALLSQVNTNDETMFSFPVNTGNSFQDTSIFITKTLGSSLGMPYDSVMQISTVFRHDTIDGSGQLIVSGYTLNNLYRNIITDNKVDSMFSYSETNGWQFLETITRNFKNIFWLDTNDFFAAWMEVRNDTVNNIKVRKYNPSIRLELVNFPSYGIENQFLSGFEVRAYNISDNSLATDFNDFVTIVTNNSIVFTQQNIVGGIVQAVSGVASFNNVYFSLPGNFDVSALSDTAEASPFESITIASGPDSLAITNLFSASEGQILSPVEVHLFNSSGNPDLNYSGNINIGKLSGNGKIAGTLTQPLLNGIATFDDLVFNHSDIYNLIAWLPGIDSAIIDSEFVNITVNQNLQWTSAGTDTLSEYVDRASFFGWIGGIDGYLSGSSRKWYDHVGQHYTFSSKGLLTKVIFYFANRMPDFQITNDTYKVRVYDAGILLQNPSPFSNGFLNDSLPVRLLGEQTFSYTDVHPTDFFIRTPSVITFDTPIEIYSDFIVALEVNNSLTTDDTLIIWTNMPGDGMLENRSMRHTINHTNPFMVEGWIRDLDWRSDYNRDNMIMPIIEVDTMDIVTSVRVNEKEQIHIYPNPTTGKITLYANEIIVKIEITDLSGRLAFTNSFNLKNNNVFVDLQNLSSGLYNAQIYFNTGTAVKEKLVILKP